MIRSRVGSWALVLVGLTAGTPGVGCRRSSVGEGESSITQSVVAGGNCGYGRLPSNSTWVQPGYTFVYRHWLMKGNPITPSDDWLGVEWTPPPNIPVSWNCLRAFDRKADGSLQYLWTSGITAGATQQLAAVLKVGASSLAPGVHHIVLVADDQDLTFADLAVNVTAPVYAIISADWDEPPNGYGSIDSILGTMDAFRRVNGLAQPNGVERPGFVYSHFVGPYIWGAPAYLSDGSQRAPTTISGSTTARIETWLKLRKQDEIGVHIHPWTSAFLQNVPVPPCCATSACGAGTQCPSSSRPVCCTTMSCAPETECGLPAHVVSRLDATSVWDTSDLSGYATLIRAFSPDEIVAMLDYSSQILVSRGFPQPTSFRAGGWTGSSALLAALGAAHKYSVGAPDGTVQPASGSSYLVDSSSTWPDPVCALLPDTNHPTLCTALKSASGLSQTTVSTSQPYRSASSGIVEIPDNGVLLDYMTGAASAAGSMESILAAIGGTAAVSTPMMYQIGFHPHTMLNYASRFEAALENIDANAYAFDKGPVVYAAMSSLANVSWPTQ
jgi:hypothetical protein